MEATNLISIHDRKALRIHDAARYSGLSRSTIYNLLSEGRLQSIKIGRSRLIIKASLDRLLTVGDLAAAA